MKSRNKVLVTGGAGYIGSHTCIELINSGWEVIIVDNLSTSSPKTLSSIEKITGKKIKFYKTDLLNVNGLRTIFQNEKPHSVIHFAACKSVGESVEKPLKYYTNNIYGLLNLLKCMIEFNTSCLVFSSSCTVYGEPEILPVTEKTPLNKAQNPYAYSKQVSERVIEDACNVSQVKSIILRYFNPIGAHSSGLIGDNPEGRPDNLIPFLCRTAKGIYKQLTVFGDDYDTPDGSCIRDYIHITDLCKAHLKALKRLESEKSKESVEVFNIGTGKGNSVLEIIKMFETVTKIKLNWKFGPRRSGDLSIMYADVNKSTRILKWKSQLGLKEMLLSSWKWEQNNIINNK